MYGKIFSSMYEGSMVGAGAVVFAVMGYIVSKQSPPDFNVELNAKLLSAILGEPESEVQEAIEYLASPDPGSRTDKEEGRRIIKVGAFTYHVVNGELYHNIRNYEERKAYNRMAQAKYRDKKKLEGVKVPGPLKGPVRFKKPTKSELVGAGLSESEADKFINYYESKGWVVGKSPMKSWKGAVANWKSNSWNGSEGKTSSGMTDKEILEASQG